MLRKRIFIYFLGFNIMIFGISLLIWSGLGQSAWDGVNVGLSSLLGIRVGQATMISAGCLLLLSVVMTHDSHVFLSVITSMVQSLLIDVYLQVMLMLPIESTGFMKYICFFLGIFMMALGCSMYIQSNFPINHVDRFMVSLSQRFRLPLRTAKWIVDGIALGLTLILTGTVKLGTFLILVVLGPLIQMVTKQIRIPLQQYIAENQNPDIKI